MSCPLQQDLTANKFGAVRETAVTLGVYDCQRLGRGLRNTSLNLVHFPTILLKKSHYRVQSRKCQGWRRCYKGIHSFGRSAAGDANSLRRFDSRIFPFLGHYQAHAYCEPDHSITLPVDLRGDSLGCIGLAFPELSVKMKQLARTKMDQGFDSSPYFRSGEIAKNEEFL